MNLTDNPSDTRTHRIAAWALFGFTLVVAAVTFVLSFHGLDGYGRTVAQVGARLSWLVPIGVDGLTLTAVAATFLLRNARLRVRFYAWSVFVVANGASVAGNLSHGRSQHLATDGMVGAAAWPILLALASHLAIVTRRALEREKPRSAPEVPVPGQAEVAPFARAELPAEVPPELPAAEDAELPAALEAELPVPPHGGTSGSGRNNGRKSGGGSSAPKGRNNGPKVPPRRTAEETRKLVAEARAQDPEITQAKLAQQLGISDRQLRNVLRDDAADEERLLAPQPINGRHPAAVN